MRLALLSVCLLLASAPSSWAQEGQDPTVVVLMKTTLGDITLELWPKQAPETVRNFLGLAEGTKAWKTPSGEEVKKPFYDGLKFHRIIKGFMIQGGCPLGTGMGGPGFQFKDEINAASLGLDKLKAMPDGRPHPYLLVRSQGDFQKLVLMPLLRTLGISSQEQLKPRIEEVKAKMSALTLQEAYQNLGYRYDAKLTSSKPVKGVIAMANAGPNTNGSQFFINLADTPHLTGKHTVFGKVIAGMDIVEKLGEVQVAEGARPVGDIKIISIRRVKPDEQK